MNRSIPLLGVGLLVGLALGFVLSTTFGDGGEPASDGTEVAQLKRSLDRVRDDLSACETELEAEQAETARLREVEAALVETGNKANEEIARLNRIFDERGPDGTSAGGVSVGEATFEPKGLTDEKLKGRLMSFASKLQRLIMSGKTEAMKKAMADILAEGGPGTLDRIVSMFEEESDHQVKTVLAHALAQTGDAAALDKLKSVVLDPESGMIERRAASHGLAFSDEASLEAFYRQAATSDMERGARANLSYGLALRTDEGIELYGKTVDEAFAAKDPLAVGYVSGFLLLGKRSVPAVEKRLRSIKETQTRLMLIQHLATHGGADSVVVLREIASDTAATKDVREAAEKAAAKLTTDGD